MQLPPNDNAMKLGAAGWAECKEVIRGKDICFLLLLPNIMGDHQASPVFVIRRRYDRGFAESDFDSTGEVDIDGVRDRR